MRIPKLGALLIWSVCLANTEAQATQVVVKSRDHPNQSITVFTDHRKPILLSTERTVTWSAKCGSVKYELIISRQQRLIRLVSIERAWNTDLSSSTFGTYVLNHHLHGTYGFSCEDEGVTLGFSGLDVRTDGTYSGVSYNVRFSAEGKIEGETGVIDNPGALLSLGSR